MNENENEIERLIKEAGAVDPNAVEPEMGQSFRVVGGPESAQIVIKATATTAAKRVAATTISPERYLAVPIRNEPVEGYSIEEGGYDANTTKARVEMLLGPGSHLDGPTWVRALRVLDAGGKVIFTRESTSVDLHGRPVFPVRIAEQ